jgi:hypothetical protein
MNRPDYRPLPTPMWMHALGASIRQAILLTLPIWLAVAAVLVAEHAIRREAALQQQAPSLKVK